MDARVGPLTVTKLIQAQFPELPAASVRYLGEGCDSIAFEVDVAWVFRFPKRADVEAQLLVERRLLPVLQGHSPLALPDYCFMGAPSSEFPYHFGGYPRLPGAPALQIDPHAVHAASWVDPIANFLSALHRFPRDEAERFGAPRVDLESIVDECQRDAIGDVELLRELPRVVPIEQCRRFLVDRPKPATSRSLEVLTHGDFAAEHVLCDESGWPITGVIDWSDMAIADPALDFVGLFHWGGLALASAVRAQYAGEIDDEQWALARYLAVCRGVADVAFGRETNRQEYVEAGLRALSLCLPGEERKVPE